MTTTLKRLYHGQPSTAGQVVYTCPANTTAIVLARVITNPTGARATCRLGLIPSGGTADGTHYLLGDLGIEANDAYESDTKLILAAGDVLEAQSSPLPAPLYPTGATAATGGTLAAGTYYYVVTATNAQGETLPSSEITIATTGSTSANTLSWTRVLGATGYKVYRSSTTGAELLLAAVAGGATTSYTDTGATTPAGGYPVTATAAACTFTISGVELS